MVKAVSILSVISSKKGNYFWDCYFRRVIIFGELLLLAFGTSGVKFYHWLLSECRCIQGVVTFRTLRMSVMQVTNQQSCEPVYLFLHHFWFVLKKQNVFLLIVHYVDEYLKMEHPSEVLVPVLAKVIIFHLAQWHSWWLWLTLFK